MTTRPSLGTIPGEGTAGGFRILARMIAAAHKRRLRETEAPETQLTDRSPARSGSCPPTGGKKKERSDNARG